MTDTILLWIAQGVALLGWLALLLAPKLGRDAIRWARLIGAALSIGYLALFLSAPEGLSGLVRDYTPKGIGAVFSDPRLALLGWVHYLAFDLWIGSWEAEEAARTRMPHGLLILSLVLTCMVGPIGLLFFLAVGRFRSRRPR